MPTPALVHDIALAAIQSVWTKPFVMSQTSCRGLPLLHQVTLVMILLGEVFVLCGFLGNCYLSPTGFRR